MRSYCYGKRKPRLYGILYDWLETTTDLVKEDLNCETYVGFRSPRKCILLLKKKWRNWLFFVIRYYLLVQSICYSNLSQFPRNFTFRLFFVLIKKKLDKELKLFKKNFKFLSYSANVFHACLLNSLISHINEANQRKFRLSWNLFLTLRFSF